MLLKLAAVMTLESYLDADSTSCVDDRDSTSGYVVFFFGGNLNFWSAKKQHLVARSSTESEFRALANVVAEIKWITSLLNELHVKMPYYPVIWVDNQSVIALAANLVFHARSKHIEMDLYFVRDQILSVRYVLSLDLIANVLTKSLSTNISTISSSNFKQLQPLYV
uniref:Uncharacterized protein n=1 Tax=Cannabis sativa TaxID=3483 RepID=A0A803PX01_CANSA